MKKKLFLLLAIMPVFIISCVKTELKQPEAQFQKKTDALKTITTSTATVTRPYHVVVVWFENKGYSQIIGSSSAPYINSLVSKGTLFTNSYANFHPSYPNYVAFFSGSNHGITSDQCITGKPFNSPNLYSALLTKGVYFRWFSEGLPNEGSRVCSDGPYVEKHNPTTIFANVSNSANRPLSYLNLTDTLQFRYWPRVACVTPNLDNDMHDGSISRADAWLKAKFSKYVNWAMTHNSMLVVYFDEDNRKTNNRIPVIVVGQHIKQNFKLSTRYDHYNWTKTICDWWGVDANWNNNVRTRSVITGFYR